MLDVFNTMLCWLCGDAEKRLGVSTLPTKPFGVYRGLSAADQTVGTAFTHHTTIVSMNNHLCHDLCVDRPLLIEFRAEIRATKQKIRGAAWAAAAPPAVALQDN